jgi:transposase
MAYSVDLRERIVQAVDDGMTKRRAARTFRVGLNTVKRYVDQYHETGDLKPKPIPGRPPEIKVQQEPLLVAQAEATPDASLAEHCDSWAKSQGVRVSPSTMCRMLKRVKWTRKKKRR